MLTYPSTLSYDPGGKLVLEVSQSHFFHAHGHACAHPCQLDGTASETEHEGYLLPAWLIANVLVEDVVEVHVTLVSHQLCHDWSQVWHLD